MARLKRKQAKDASNIIRSTWPLSEVDVDVSQCWGNALVLAFNTSTINAVTEEQCRV